MTEEMKTETMELCVTACEKYSTNYEVCVCFNLFHTEVTVETIHLETVDCLRASAVTDV